MAINGGSSTSSRGDYGGANQPSPTGGQLSPAEVTNAAIGGILTLAAQKEEAARTAAHAQGAKASGQTAPGAKSTVAGKGQAAPGAPIPTISQNYSEKSTLLSSDDEFQ